MKYTIAKNYHSIIVFVVGLTNKRHSRLISSQDHFQRSSPSRISDRLQSGIEPAQNLSSGFVEWSYAVAITTTPQSHYHHHHHHYHYCHIWFNICFSRHAQLKQVFMNDPAFWSLTAFLMTFHYSRSFLIINNQTFSSLATSLLMFHYSISSCIV